MRSHTFSALVFVALAAAAPAPRPQDIDIDLAYALPDPTATIAFDVTAQAVTYTPAAIFSSALEQITSTIDASASPLTTDAATTGSADLAKRAAASCTSLPSGSGPIPTPDSASGFLAFPAYTSTALNAPTPSGYTQTFANLNASNNAYGYLGYTTLTSYDVNKCASKCNAINGCLAINIYFERDPSVDPGSGTQCSDPPSTANIKCTFWGGPVTPGNAVNTGQWRNKFQVVIAGSNGYVSNAIASVPGYGSILTLGNAAITAPYDSYGFDSYMGSAIFTAGPFNASLCAQACTTKSNHALANPPTDGSPVQTCQFFNTYILYINSTSNPANNQGQYCAMYSESWPKSYATNSGQWRGSDHFMIQYSFAFSNQSNSGAANPNAAVHQASKDISWSTLQPFCSSYLGYTTSLTTTQTLTTVTPVSTVIVPTTVVTTVTTIQKRDSATDATVGLPKSIISAMRAPAIPSAVGNVKRALSTPAVLTKYPTAILSSACSLQATTPPASTVTVISTITAPTTTTTLTSAVATTTATLCSLGPITTQSFKLAIVAPGTPYDGATINNLEDEYYYLGISTDPYYSAYSPIVWNFDITTGAITDVNGSKASIGWVGEDGRQLIMSLGHYYPIAVCSIDADTLLISCTATSGETTISSGFYITSNSLTQLSLATGSFTYSDGFQGIPVQVKAICV